ncbi:MAG: LamG domain-containing protein [Candidatus Aenigmarchaeota archaeon]|nr:LamG domain-containing protein [Candidatus Aenigmarchaeota archaeon]
MKAITPVISLVMLLLITVGLVGTSYIFISSSFSSKISNVFSIIYSSQNTVIVRNDGTQPITSFIATLDGNQENMVIVPGVSGLVAYWGFNDGAGSVAKDSQGTTNFEIRNLVTWVDGKFGKAVKIGETADTGCSNQNAGVYTNSIPAAIQSLPQNSFTQSWWNYLPVSSGASRVHMASATVPGCGTCSVWNLRNYVEVRTVSGGNSDISYTAPSTNAWHHMAYVFDKPSLRHKFYIDGEPVADNPLVNGDYGSVQWLAVGVYSPSCTDAIPGAIYDEYGIYSRALGADEIKKLYSSAVIEPGKTATLKTLTTPPAGKHDLILCTANICNTVTLTMT